MMNFVLKMMTCVFKMMDFSIKNDELCIEKDGKRPCVLQLEGYKGSHCTKDLLSFQCDNRNDSCTM